MRTRQLSHPSALPISLSQAKDHLRIEQDETAYDSDVTHLIQTAAEWVQDNCHVYLNETEIEAVFEKFPKERQFKLPGWPVQSVDSLRYDDVNGVEQTLTGYQTDLIDCPASIYPAVGHLCCYHNTYCPTGKNFVCTRAISPKMVIEKIKENNLL